MPPLLNRAVTSTFVLFATLFVTTSCLGQIPARGPTTSTPVPGAGHDYIHMLNETVNPASGSLSVRIGVPVPPDRGITLPFGYSYDSNGVNYIGFTSFGGFGFLNSYSKFSQGGWTYTVPQMTVGRLDYTVSAPNGTQNCFAVFNYVFQDSSGNRHNMDLAVSGYNQGAGGGNCSDGENPYYDQLQGGEGPILATTTAHSSNTQVNPVTVTDADGTVYSFPWTLKPPDADTYVTDWLAAGVVDRDGNTIFINRSGTGFNIQDSVGRTAVTVSGFAQNPDTIAVSGLANPYSVYWTLPVYSYTISMTPEDQQSTCTSLTAQTGSSATTNAVSRIVLPNGQQYIFSYDPVYGVVNKITYPSGAYVRYVWGLNAQSQYGSWARLGPVSANQNFFCDAIYDTVAVQHRYVSFDGTNEVLQQDFSYSTAWNMQGVPTSAMPSWTSKQTIVTTNDLVRGTSFNTIYQYSFVYGDVQPNAPGNQYPQVPVENTISYYDTGGGLLKTVQKSWINERIMKSQVTSLGGLTSETDWTYDPNKQEQVIEQDDYDYGSGAHGSLLRKTVTNYRNFGSNTHIVDRPQQVVVSDSSKNLAESDYTYDSFGNMLSETKKCFDINSGQACPTSNAITSFTYDGFGHAITKTDPGTAANPAGYTTQYSYTDSFTDSSVTNTNAYLTQITYPQTNGVNHVESFSYSYADGVLRQHVDENSHITGYSYNDPLQRLTDTTFDGTELVNNSYDDAYPPTVTKTTYAAPDPNIVSVMTYDGMDHATKSQLTSDPEGTDTTDTVYDGSGRVLSVSNPYRSSTGSTNGTTNYLYDALGRTVQVSPPDGTFPFSGTTCLTNNVCTSYSGNTTTVTDQAGNQKKSITDALGRVTEVDEPGLSGAPATTASGSVVISGTENSTQVLVRAATTASGSSLLAGSVQWKNVSASGATTAGTTTVTVNGGEQQYPAGVIAGTGSVTIGGSEQAPAHTQVAAPGTGSVSVNGTLQSKQVLAQAAAGGSGNVTINGGEQSTQVQTAAATQAIGNVTISGSLKSKRVTPCYAGNGPCSIQDSGDVWIQVGGYTAYAYYGGGSDPVNITSGLVSAINNNSSFPATASSSGGPTLFLTSKAAGSSANMTLNAGTDYDDADFASPSFSASTSGSTLTGGQDPQYTTVYDSGTTTITVNGYSDSVSWGSGANNSTIASALASTINGDGSAPVYASASGATVYLSARAQGSWTNYSLSSSYTYNSSYFGGSSFTTSNSGGSLTGGIDASYNTIYDSGTATITVNGRPDSYSWSGSGTTAASIASGLGSVINADGGAPVSAGVSGSTVTLTAKTTGASTNYSLSSSSSFDSADFSGASFSTSNSGGALTGGKDDIYVYDSGTATITVNSHSNTVNWANGSTASSIASSLVSAMNADSGAAVTASLSGATVNLTAKIKGSISNYSLASSQTYNTAYFTQSSFSTSASGPNLVGGWPNPNAVDSGNVNVTVNGHAYSAAFGQSSTPGSIATALVNAINGDANVTASLSGATVYVNPKNPGQTYGFSTAYTWDSGDFPNPSFTQSNSISDWGNATLTVNGHSDSVPWSSSATASNVAAALANQINGDAGAFVNATASGGTLSLIARLAGAAPNSYPASTSASFDTANFSQNQWSAGTSWTTTQGQNAIYNTVYDSGKVSVNVDYFQASATYQQGSSPSSVASALAASLNGSSSSPVSATASGATVTLTARQPGSAGNYSVSTAGNPSTAVDVRFTNDSCSACVGTAVGGGDRNLFVNSISVGSTTIYPNDPSVSYTAAPCNSTQNNIAYILCNGDMLATVAGSVGQTVTISAYGSPDYNVYPHMQVYLNGVLAGQWDVTGSAQNYTVSSTSSFGGSFTAAGANLAGGSDATLSLSTPAVTQYQYDVLGNLNCAVQKVQDTTAFTSCSSAPSAWRPRSFVYNSLSQLTSATNPESGTMSYAYDPSGNVLSKTSPAQNQPSGSTTLSYCYDPLNRLTSKAYSQQSCPQSSPIATYSYDSGTNDIGHRTGMTDSSGSTGLSYDARGRLSTETHNINSIAKSVTYGYDLASAVTSITYPSSRVVNYAVSGAGRTLSSIDPSGASYVTGATYSPDGQIAGYQNGSTLTITDTYNKRLQPITLSAATPSQTVFSLSYDFHLGTVDNGNVYSIINNRDNNRTQNFSYDALNRIQQAWTSGPNWGETFTIDPWGNLTNRGPINGKQWYENFDDAPALPTNQLAGYGYDAAGNMTNNGFAGFTYDAENRIATTGGWNYIYDGDGNRVEKASGATGTLYWAGSSNDALAESNLSGTLQSEYIFFNGKRIARLDFPSGTVHYYFSDHLGSTSIVTDASGTIQNESDYYPYGGEIAYTTNDTNHYKFTGKERDSESNLDYFGARYFSSTMGRWMSPDWAAKPTEVPYAEFGDPQSLNLYGYVRNNPLSKADVDGHCFWDLCIGEGAAVYVVGGALITAGAASIPQVRQGVVEGFRAINSGLDYVAGKINQGLDRLRGSGTAPPQVNTTNPASQSQAGTVGTTTQAVDADTKDRVRDNAGGKCEYCGKNTTTTADTASGRAPAGDEGQTDHYKPKSKGGTDDESNLVHACRDCNGPGGKGNADPTNPNDASGQKWRLPRMEQPKKPD